MIHGDAKGCDVLLSAGIERARGICIVIDNDLNNLSITITARSPMPSSRPLLEPANCVMLSPYGSRVLMRWSLPCKPFMA